MTLPDDTTPPDNDLPEPLLPLAGEGEYLESDLPLRTRAEWDAWAKALGKQDRLQRRRQNARQRRENARLITEAKRLGASAVTTPEGVTYTLGTEPSAETNPFELEAARLRRGA